MNTLCTATVRDTPAPAPERRPGVLIATLSAVVLTVAVLQTSVVPILDVIARQLPASPVAVSWVVTANLLAAAAATPLVGRLADLRDKKQVLLTVLALVLAGSLLGAVTTSLPALIVARVLQGLSFSLYPIAVSILREELPPGRVIRAMATMSAMLGLGGAAGLVITGMLMTGDAGYHRVFWLSTVLTAAVGAAAAGLVPGRPRRVRATVDWPGAGLLALGLCAVLLAVTQGTGWGWTAPATLGAAATGVAALGAWWRHSGRTAHPLVSMTMLARRPILLANGATLLVGMGLYFSFLGLTDFVEAPTATGHGFGATVLQASLEFLLPGALAAALTAVVSGRCIDRFGARAVVVSGALAGAVGFLMLAGWHTAKWEVILAGLLTNAYISLAYSALPALIVSDVGSEQTGIATSLNGVVRTVGGALAAALVAALLGAGRATESGFTAVFLLGAATAAGSLLLIRLIRPGNRPIG